MKTISKYESFDGQVFDTAEACRSYEAENVVGRIIGLSAEQVQAAIERTDVDLADAIEAVAGRITKRRYEMGEKRRTRKAEISKPGDPTAVAQEGKTQPGQVTA